MRCSSGALAPATARPRDSTCQEARKRRIEPVELHPGEDLDELVCNSIVGGADALAMACGVGSQAIVATHAAREGLPYACIPAVRRNSSSARVD